MAGSGARPRPKRVKAPAWASAKSAVWRWRAGYTVKRSASAGSAGSGTTAGSTCTPTSASGRRGRGAVRRAPGPGGCAAGRGGGSSPSARSALRRRSAAARRGRRRPRRRGRRGARRRSVRPLPTATLPPARPPLAKAKRRPRGLSSSSSRAASSAFPSRDVTPTKPSPSRSPNATASTGTPARDGGSIGVAEGGSSPELSDAATTNATGVPVAEGLRDGDGEARRARRRRRRRGSDRRTRHARSAARGRRRRSHEVEDLVVVGPGNRRPVPERRGPAFGRHLEEVARRRSRRRRGGASGRRTGVQLDRAACRDAGRGERQEGLQMRPQRAAHGAAPTASGIGFERIVWPSSIDEQLRLSGPAGEARGQADVEAAEAEEEHPRSGLGRALGDEARSLLPPAGRRRAPPRCR